MTNKKRILLSISVLGLISSLFFALPSKNFHSVEASVGNHTTGTNDTDYYSNFDFNKEGQEMLAQVHDLMVSTHKTYSSYDDSGKNNYQQYTDAYYEGENKVSGYIFDFYTGAKMRASWDGSYYNREHVWPQSLSDSLWGKDYGGADMHHIRPTVSASNSSRGNKKFGLVGSDRDNYKKTFTVEGKSYLGGYTKGTDGDSSNPFEPIDSKKGDVARIVLYMYTHYNSSSSSIFGGFAKENESFFSSSLAITNVVAGTNEQALDMLVDWNKLDPVDLIETRRNDQVAIYQGNRNVFIDHPELVDIIWGEGSSGNVNVRSISIEKDNYDLAIGEELQINATVLPSNATDKSVTWTSSNSKIATVTNEGTLIGLDKGTVTLTATTNDGGYSDTCSVKVGTKTLSNYESFAITINNFEKTSVYGTIDDWSSYDSEYNSFLGQADISTEKRFMQFNSSNENSCGFYNTTPTKKALSSFKFLTASLSQTKEQTFTLYLSKSALTKENYTNATASKIKIGGNSVSYTFSIDVNSDYRYFYFISSQAAYFDSIFVTYEKEAVIPTSISLSSTSISLDKGQSKTLTATINPLGAVQDEILWTSSNTLVATVSNGNITAVGKGSATITAKLKNYTNIYANCSVTVTENVQPEDPIPTTNGVLVVDDKTTTSANLTTGKYLIVAKANGTFNLLNSSSVDSSGKYNPVSVSNLTNLDSYTSGTFTITKTNSNVSIYSDSTSKYLGNGGSSTSFAVPSSSETTWTYEASEDGVLFTSTVTTTRGLIFRAGSYNVFGFYATSNLSNSEYSAPHLYKVDTAFNFLITKLQTMNCGDMTNSIFYNRIQYLFNKLSVEERNTLATLNIKCNDGKTYNAYDAYMYAINQYSGHNSNPILIYIGDSKNSFIEILTVISLLGFISIGLIIRKKTAKVR